MIYHSLILDENEDQNAILQKVENTTSSTDILLKYPPKYICVKVPSSEPHRFENRKLVSGEVVIPLPLEKDTKLTQINNPELLMNFSVITARHSVEMKFSLTAHKVQGQTCSKIILDLNNRPSPPHMSLSSLYVGLSRVRSSNCLRLLPKQTSKPDFEHLLKLKIPVSILRWKKGFDLQTGIWSRHATHSETNENVSTRKRGRKTK